MGKVYESLRRTNEEHMATISTDESIIKGMEEKYNIFAKQENDEI